MNYIELALELEMVFIKSYFLIQHAVIYEEDNAGHNEFCADH